MACHIVIKRGETMPAAKKQSLKGLGWEKSNAAPPVKTDSEKGLVKVIFRMSKDGKKQLDIMAAEDGRTKQELLCEAVNDFLQKHGRQRTA